MDPVSITRDLVELPSYQQELEVGEYIYRYLRKFDFLELSKQPVAPGRFNVLARTSGEPQLVLAGHMDTVVPKTGSKQNPLRAKLEGSRLYGLGAYDMKGGIASILSALSQVSNPSGLRLLFYCDEEYDFRGMKAFLGQAETKERPQLALIAEPTDLKIWNEHRGLIELELAVGGISGHAANPAAGLNAIIGVQTVLSQLGAWLNTFDSPTLGTPSLNVSYLRGGLNQGEESGEIRLGKDGNNIADFAEAILDIRPTKPELRAEQVMSKLTELVNLAGLKLLRTDVKHDFGALFTSPDDLSLLEKITDSSYLDARAKGYGDGQLIQAAWNIPLAYLGPAGGNAHAPDEWVNTRSLQTLTDMYARVIRAYCA